MELLKAQLRSWFDMLRKLHIAMKVLLIDGHSAEESGAFDIGLSYSMARRLRRLEAEIRSLTPVESLNSSMQSVMVVHCYCFELDNISLGDQVIPRFVFQLTRIRTPINAARVARCLVYLI